jgi:hypothetical protein
MERRSDLVNSPASEEPQTFRLSEARNFIAELIAKQFIKVIAELRLQTIQSPGSQGNLHVVPTPVR